MEGDCVVMTGARGRLASVLAQTLGPGVKGVSRSGGAGHYSYDEFLTPNVLSRPRVIFHMAWSSVPATAESNPRSAWEEDLPLMRRLLDAVASLPVETRPYFVFFSSGGAVYGERDTPASETDEPSPRGAYGRGKVAGEELLRSFSDRLRTCSLRISNPYGFPHDPQKPQGIVGAALHALRTGIPMPLYGGGSARKDFLHMDDLTEALRLVAAQKPVGCYNVCAGESFTVASLIELIGTLAGRPVPVTPVPAAPWDIKSSLLSPEKFSTTTGWRAQRSLREGLADALRQSGVGTV